VVSPRRFDRRTLHVWSLDTALFGNEQRRARLLAITSGWPALVARAVGLAAELGSEDRALTELDYALHQPDAATDFIDQVGLAADAALVSVFDSITALVDAKASLADLLDAAALSGHPQPAAAVACLESLGVFDIDEGGIYQVDPLLVRCWPYRRSP
jgi:hypothetical protein